MTLKRLPLHAICPYFAMFPESFVREHVKQYSDESDWILDPFCGRGTTVLESLLLGRNAIGSDINPVAYCVSHAKADHPDVKEVTRHVD
ncbi:MAG: site-specific DNA-methyltransferase, partial [Planctomycetes bacterium]|nr:site-specific DNA-methyltransferase [Planctomycetota bacterium]